MNGDYTKVALRPGERWTGARMQQGRVLLDHEWNLNIDAAARTAQTLAYDAIGPRGVLRGTDFFQVQLATPTGGPNPEIRIRRGWMWVGGQLAVAPRDFALGSQDGITQPTTGRHLIVLDAFSEHVQPAEAPSELIEPALAPTDSAARTRIGYRVRAVATTAASGRQAWEEFIFNASNASTGMLTVTPVQQTASTDPCAPAPSASTMLPDGLLRIEVLDAGDEKSCLFAWSFENGSASAPVVKPVAGNDVVVVPPPGVVFQQGDLVELSWLARRGDRANHGLLYTVTNPQTDPDGTRLTLSRQGGVAAPPQGAKGIVVRRWDGQAVGNGTPHDLEYRGQKYATFKPEAGRFEAGDWWGVRVRRNSGAVEALTKDLPDGTTHAFAPLALVDLGAKTVEDLRPKFRSLSRLGPGTCSVTVYPEDNVQAVIDSLASNVEICFQPGEYELQKPLTIANRNRVTLKGAGPATIIRITSVESAVVFDTCSEVTVSRLRVEGGKATVGTTDGALMFLSCRDVRVEDCVIGCRDAAQPKRVACVTARPKALGSAPAAGAPPDRIRIERTSLEVGSRQVAVLLVDHDEVRVADNRVSLTPPISGAEPPPRYAQQGIVVGGHDGRARIVQILDNVVNDAAQGIHVGLESPSQGQRARAGDILIRGNIVNVLLPIGYSSDRHAIYVGNSDCIHVVGNAATLRAVGGGTRPPTEGVVIKASSGPFMLVRDNCFDFFNIGVRVEPPAKADLPAARMWLVAETMAANGSFGVDAPAKAEDGSTLVELVRNYPVPEDPKVTALTVSPAVIPAGLTGIATVTLHRAARTGGAKVTLTNSDSAVLGIPAEVTVAAGATTATFVVTAKSPTAFAESTITATLLESKPFKVGVQPKPAVKAVTLSQSSIEGGGTVTGTITLTAPDPAAKVMVTSSNSSVVTVSPAEVAIPSGTTGTFTLNVTTSGLATPQDITITASFGGVDQTAQLSVSPKPLLKVNRVRVLSVNSATPTAAPLDVLFDSGTSGNTFVQTKVADVDVAFVPNAIEIEFANAAADVNSVTLQTFLVDRSGSTTEPQGQTVIHVSGNTFRWVATSMPHKAPTLANRQTATDYDVTLVGDGTPAIKADHGRRLDGNFLAFPSGDALEGGNFVFTLRLHAVFDIDETDIQNDHIRRSNEAKEANQP
jgi:hypothetical protein